MAGGGEKHGWWMERLALSPQGLVLLHLLLSCPLRGLCNREGMAVQIA